MVSYYPCRRAGPALRRGVLILIVMDNGLLPLRYSSGERVLEVLILIVMDNGLLLWNLYSPGAEHSVLILIVMDNGLLLVEHPPGN